MSRRESFMVMCDNCDQEQLLEVAHDWLLNLQTGHDFCPNCIIRLDDDPFTKMDIPEEELPFVEIDRSGVFIQIVDPDLVVMVRRKEASVVAIPKKGGKE